MDELSKTEIINGYEFFVPYNEIIARQIDYSGYDYSIKHKTECYCSEIYKIFGKEKKMIGKLCYNPDTNKLVLHKFINIEKHIFNKTNQLGINEKIFKNLRVCDYIVFHINNVPHIITVSKALKSCEYRNFKDSWNSELQVFINISDLKVKDSKNGNRRNKK